MCKVSIIVPVYNVEAYLEECMNSLVHQTLREIEIICINDGSTDESVKILEQYKEKDKRIRIIHQPNKGLSAARNKGLEYAKGEYVYFCDSDDYLRCDAMEICYHNARKRNIDVLRFGVCVFVHEKIEEVDYIECFLTPRVVSGVEMFDFLEQHKSKTPGTPFFFIKRNYLENYHIRFIEGIIHEDHSFFIELLMHAERTYHIDEPLYCRRVRKGSITQTIHYYKATYGFWTTIRYFLQKERELGNVIVMRKRLHRICKLFTNNYLQLDKEEKKRIKGEVNCLRKELMKTSILCFSDKVIFISGGWDLYGLYKKVKHRVYEAKVAIKRGSRRK